jgi:hypothetical protein
MEQPLPNRANDRTDKLDPIMVPPRIDMHEPMRTNDLTLREEPRLLISITLMECKEPILLTPSTLRPEPQRTNDRTERLDPELNQPATEIASPIRAKLRMDKPEPIELAAKHDMPPANRPKLLILNELAIST